MIQEYNKFELKNKYILIVGFAILIFLVWYFFLRYYISYDFLVKNHDMLLLWRDNNYNFTVISFVVIYILIVSLSLPGASLMSLTGGFLFSTFPGVPTLSDPGSLLVKKCVEKEISIYPIPGPSSITASASISGFEDQFLFYGFLPKKEKELEKSLSYLKNLKFSIIFFIPGLKVNFYLKKFKEFFIERDILLLFHQKIHETFYINH